MDRWRSSRIFSLIRARRPKSKTQPPPAGLTLHAPLTEVDELFHRIQLLPQEMKDHIFECFINIPPSGDIRIRKTYKPPVQLQIDRKSRAKAINIYYRSPQVFTLRAKYIPDWLKSLDGASRMVIHEIHLYETQDGPVEIHGEIRRLRDALIDAHTFIDYDAFKMRAWYYNYDDEEWREWWMNEEEARWLWQVAPLTGLKPPLWKRSLSGWI